MTALSSVDLAREDCRSCHSGFVKTRRKQVYCSARCRAREKRQRRQSRQIPLDQDQLYSFIANYISAKGYAPLGTEMCEGMHCDPRANRLKTALDKLEQQGRIKRHSWTRGITLAATASKAPPPPVFETTGDHLRVLTPKLLTVDGAVDWKCIAKAFHGVLVSKLTASQIARYFRTRCMQVGRDMAERESNLLLGLRFPEVFLERRANLDQAREFLDRASTRRGCQSCHARFVKVHRNQTYCSTRCRAREKRHRRQSIPRGKLLKSAQNKRYRANHRERESQVKREWRANHPKQYGAQRAREGTRRTLKSQSARRSLRLMPPSVAAIQHGREQLHTGVRE